MASVDVQSSSQCLVLCFFLSMQCSTSVVGAYVMWQCSSQVPLSSLIVTWYHLFECFLIGINNNVLVPVTSAMSSISISSFIYCFVFNFDHSSSLRL